MAIPYNNHLQWGNYRADQAYANLPAAPAPGQTNGWMEGRRIAMALVPQTIGQIFVRCIQFLRDALRLVLKVPYRSIRTPAWKTENWKQKERAKVNLKLVGYSFVQVVGVPVKFLVALGALVTLPFSLQKAKAMMDRSDDWTAHLDGRASQLEALKEEGRNNAQSLAEFNAYKNWLYGIDPKLCR